MKNEELDALEEAAEKARGWKWETAQGNEFGHLNEDGCFYEIGSIDADQYAVNDEPHNETVLNFITRATPETVSWMIARIRELEDTGKSAEAVLYREYYEADRAYVALQDEVSPGLLLAPTFEDRERLAVVEERFCKVRDAIAEIRRAAPEGGKEGGE